jgi:hypothetical protein
MKLKLQVLVFMFLHSVFTSAFACEATLNLHKLNGFVYRGAVGEQTEYTQHVYSGEGMSFSTVVFASKPNFEKNKVLHSTSQNMHSTVVARTKSASPRVQVLNDNLLSIVDERLAFLSYIKYGKLGTVNIEASSVIKARDCWAILRFTALGKGSRDEAMDIFASLIQNTHIVDY